MSGIVDVMATNTRSKRKIPAVTAQTFAPLAGALKALTDPNRLFIFHLLRQAGRPMTGVEVLDAGTVAQPTVAHHLRTLHVAGLVDRRREGKSTFFSVNEANYANLLAQAAQIGAPVPA